MDLEGEIKKLKVLCYVIISLECSFKVGSDLKIQPPSALVSSPSSFPVYA